MQTVMAMVMKAETGNKAQAAAVKIPTIEERFYSCYIQLGLLFKVLNLLCRPFLSKYMFKGTL